MRVIVAGSRTFKDAEKLNSWCDRLTEGFTVEYVLSGEAQGADTLGEMWAIARGHAIKKFPADWGRHGRAAGVMRNGTMANDAAQLDSPGMLIAFWDGESRGTFDMIKRAVNKGMFVHVIRFHPNPGTVVRREA